MASVSIFLEVYDDAPPYPFLDRLICQWRRVEDATRESCGLPSVSQAYPGCWNPTRGHAGGPVTVQSNEGRHGNRRRNLRNATVPKSAHQILFENGMKANTSEHKKIILDDVNFRDADWTEEEWVEWIEGLSAEGRDAGYTEADGRVLLEGDHLPFHNYQFLIDCRTEVRHVNLCAS